MHLRETFIKFFADRGTHLAAMIAYFALLSFVPLLFLALAGILLATGILRFCPIYYALGLTTSKPADKARGKYE